jgi:hypothetical protein
VSSSFVFFVLLTLEGEGEVHHRIYFLQDDGEGVVKKKNRKKKKRLPKENTQNIPVKINVLKKYLQHVF